LISARGFKWLPLLPGIETLWIAVDNDPAGQKRGAELKRLWAKAGREVLTGRSEIGNDLNDEVR